jgi:hypothetical protein
MRVNPLISSTFSGDLENDAKPQIRGEGRRVIALELTPGDSQEIASAAGRGPKEE